jgi:hypothetical protein
MGRLLLAFLLGASLVGMKEPAEAALIDYVGFGWETVGFPPSQSGDELVVMAVSTQVDPLFGVDLAAAEATVVLYGLISTGGYVDPGTGWTYVTYTGGTLEVWEDPSRDHDWGVFPPNAQTPTFSNGSLLFRGAFTSFTLTLSTSGAGVFEGTLDGTGGSALGSLCTGCAYSFAGAFTRDTGAQIPEGYDLQVDGILDVDSAVPAEPAGWGALKAQYGR